MPPIISVIPGGIFVKNISIHLAVLSSGVRVVEIPVSPVVARSYSTIATMGKNIHVK